MRSLPGEAGMEWHQGAGLAPGADRRPGRRRGGAGDRGAFQAGGRTCVRAQPQPLRAYSSTLTWTGAWAGRISGVVM